MWIGNANTLDRQLPQVMLRVTWVKMAFIRSARTPFARGLAVLIAFGLGSSSTSHAWGEVPGDDSRKTLEMRQEEEARETTKQKFLHDHSDSSGRIRQDLWQKGMEHAGQMPVAAQIGARTTLPPAYK
jgi:hypothetical protein